MEKRILLPIFALVFGALSATAATTPAPAIAEIEELKLKSPCSNSWCGGTMTIAGETVVIPDNLLIDLPANRLSLRQIFDQAPAACKAKGESGLAKSDTCLNGAKGAQVSVFANRATCGTVIAGDMFIQKGPEILTGIVTFINHTEGYFRVDGQVGSDAGGTLVRINDPTRRHTIQQGKGCADGPNCSPDPRFALDRDNYTASFANGYPLCLPSQVIVSGHTVPSGANGVGDPRCPNTNRGSALVPDSTKFAPVLAGDQVTIMGSIETVGAARFFSAHTATVNLGLTTRNESSQPDYLQITDTVWDLPDFPLLRARARFMGTSTLADSQLDLFALRVDPRNNSSHDDLIGSTVGNPRTTGLALGGPGGIWRIRYDVDFVKGIPVKAELSPCTNLRNSGVDRCGDVATLAEEFSIVSPPSREVKAVSRHKQTLNSGVVSIDLVGNEAPNGEFTRPLGAALGGLVFPPAAEFNLAAFTVPLIFEGVPWTLDRRLSPSGCVGSCQRTAAPLSPYPASGLDPRGIKNLVPASAADRTLTFFTFSGGELIPHVFSSLPAESCPVAENMTVERWMLRTL